jgi:hypothetical protein
MPTTKTDLLDRYLHAVKFWLPKAQQQDILAELASDLQSQIDDREAALGHALTEDDLVDILKKRGSPLDVADAFLPEQRLINPAMLPVYRLVLKIVLLWVLLPLFVIVFIGPLFASAHPERALLQFCVEAWRAGFLVVGIVTVVFMMLDRYHVQIDGLNRWDPRKLPRVPASTETSTRWNLLAGAIFGILGAAFWAYFMGNRTEFVIPGGPHIILGPIFPYIFWPVLVLGLTTASIDLLAFLYPCWKLVHCRVRLGLDACQVALALLLLRNTNWVKLVATNLSAADFANVMTWIDGGIRITLVIVAIAAVFDAVKQIRILLRAGNAKPVPATPRYN